jgi:hypothetical protein
MRNQKNENQIKSNDRDETGKKSTQDKKKTKIAENQKDKDHII